MAWTQTPLAPVVKPCVTTVVNGWASAGTVAATVASTTQGGVACYSITPGGSSGTSYISINTTAATGPWELRFKIYMPAATTAAMHGFAYSPGATISGSKRWQFGVTTVGVSYWNSSALTALVGVADLTAKWMDISVRAFPAANGAGNTWLEVWIGGSLVYNATSPTSLGATKDSAGDIMIGRLATGTDTSPIYIASVQFLGTSAQATPPSLTFGGRAWPL